MASNSGQHKFKFMTQGHTFRTGSVSANLFRHSREHRFSSSINLNTLQPVRLRAGSEPMSAESALTSPKASSESPSTSSPSLQTPTRGRSLYAPIHRSNNIETKDIFLAPLDTKRNWRSERLTSSPEDNPTATTHQTAPTSALGPLTVKFKLNPLERVFLEAAERGDKSTLLRCLGFKDRVNVNCVNILGRTAIQIAVDNENIELVEILLKQPGINIGDALLYAIQEGVYRIVEMLIEHPSITKETLGYSWSCMSHVSETMFQHDEESYEFSPDISPVILAAICNQFEILQLLLNRGATIEEPHKSTCPCFKCQQLLADDPLRHSLQRITTYRAMASPAWISLTSPDPILTAFELSAELLHLASRENEFKEIFISLCEQCKKYACDLLDLCRGTGEVVAVLSKGSDSESEMSDDNSSGELVGEKEPAIQANCLHPPPTATSQQQSVDVAENPNGSGSMVCYLPGYEPSEMDQDWRSMLDRTGERKRRHQQTNSNNKGGSSRLLNLTTQQVSMDDEASDLLLTSSHVRIKQASRPMTTNASGVDLTGDPTLTQDGSAFSIGPVKRLQTLGCTQRAVKSHSVVELVEPSGSGRHHGFDAHLPKTRQQLFASPRKNSFDCEIDLLLSDDELRQAPGQSTSRPANAKTSMELLHSRASNHRHCRSQEWCPEMGCCFGASRPCRRSARDGRQYTGFRSFKLDRLNLAIKLEQKKFVAHPHCQHLLTTLWYDQLPGWRKRNPITKLVLCLLVVTLLPLLAPIYLVDPHGRIGQLLRSPLIKFVNHSASFAMFIFLLLVASTDSSTQDELKLRSQIRGPDPNTIEILILWWVMGFIWSEMKQIWDEGFKAYIRQWWNWLDFLMLGLYLTTVALRVVALIQRKTNFYGNEPTPRSQWESTDPTLLSEALFSIAHIFSFARIIFLFQVNEHLGPLQISLGNMLIDITKFIFLFLLVISSFACGLHQLYYYYVSKENDYRPDSFKSLVRSYQTLFWHLFGTSQPGPYNVKMTDAKTNVTVEMKSAKLTSIVGEILLLIYHAMAIIVLINMLIAMMSNSFQTIQNHADTEWKFARSKLWVGYFDEGSTLPPPLNTIVSPKSIYRLAGRCSRLIGRLAGWCSRTASRCVSPSPHSNSWRQTIPSAPPQSDWIGFKPSNGGGGPSRVMRRLVRRYIHHSKKTMRQDGVNEDDLLEIKQDISSLRYELREDRKREAARTIGHLEGLKRTLAQQLDTNFKTTQKLIVDSRTVPPSSQSSPSISQVRGHDTKTSTSRIVLTTPTPPATVSPSPLTAEETISPTTTTRLNQQQQDSSLSYGMQSQQIYDELKQLALVNSAYEPGSGQMTGGTGGHDPVSSMSMYHLMNDAFKSELIASIKSELVEMLKGSSGTSTESVERRRIARSSSVKRTIVEGSSAGAKDDSHSSTTSVVHHTSSRQTFTAGSSRNSLKQPTRQYQRHSEAATPPPSPPPTMTSNRQGQSPMTLTTTTSRRGQQQYKSSIRIRRAPPPQSTTSSPGQG